MIISIKTLNHKIKLTLKKKLKITIENQIFDLKKIFDNKVILSKILLLERKNEKKILLLKKKEKQNFSKKTEIQNILKILYL
jgi:hypothetical protein